MTAHYDRALLLYQQSRYDLAEQELRHALAEEPDNPFSHALLALCLCDRKDHPAAALHEAEEAIHLGPDVSYTHYALAYVLFQHDQLKEAETAIEQALELDPGDADYYSLLASIRFQQRRWPAALEAAERGLELDAEHGGCTNLRAMALVKLGRRSEAGAALGDALSRDPEDALTHANQGWTFLEQREPHKALEHFREALRLDPNLEWAREGIVEALKARNFLYRQMLRYFLWMRRLSGRAQWGVLLGLVLAQELLSSKSIPPALIPISNLLHWLLIAFVVVTWTADPLFNLLLRINPLGRLALSREQIWASNCVGGFLLLALIALVGWAASGDFRFATTALVSACLILPVAGTFKCPTGWPRRVMGGYTILLAVLGFGANAFAALAAFGPFLPDRIRIILMLLSLPMLLLFFIGTVASTWLYNLLVLVRRGR
jgi:tetratricopeptide (TPR) repeat protein